MQYELPAVHSLPSERQIEVVHQRGAPAMPKVSLHGDAQASLQGQVPPDASRSPPPLRVYVVVSLFLLPFHGKQARLEVLGAGLPVPTHSICLV